MNFSQSTTPVRAESTSLAVLSALKGSISDIAISPSSSGTSTEHGDKSSRNGGSNNIDNKINGDNGKGDYGSGGNNENSTTDYYSSNKMPIPRLPITSASDNTTSQSLLVTGILSDARSIGVCMCVCDVCV